jgi:integrase
VAVEWERAAQLGRDRVLTEAVSREIIGGILERTTGEKLRQTTTREYCAEWMKGKTNSKREATATRYAGTIERFLTFLDTKADFPLAAVTARDCQRFYDELEGEKLAPASLVVEMKTVGTVFNAARRLGLVAVNPVSAVELPERIKQVKRKVFTIEQVQMLLDVADTEWQTAILLGYYAGLRLSDAITLTWEAVDFAGGKLKVETGKTGTWLEIPLHPSLEAHLSKLAGDSGGPICPNLSAVPVGGRSGLSKQFLAIMREAGISNDAAQTGGQRQLSTLSFHALRASFNSALHNQGVGQEIRKKLTGHKSNAVNDRYTTTEIATLREAVGKLPTLKVK